MYHLLIASLFSLLGMHTSFHAVHISYGNLTIAHDTLSGELTFFKDDWYKSIGHWYQQSGMPQSNAQPSTEMQAEYLKTHVRFWAGDFRSPITIAPSVSKASDLSITYQFRVVIPGGASAIIVDSRAVFSEYSDQMNLMTVKTPTGTTNLIFTADHPTSTIKS